MKKRHAAVSIRVYMLLLLLLAAGFAGSLLYCAHSSAQLRVYSFTPETPVQDELSVSVSVSKQWDDDTLHPDEPCGAQYDGVLTNAGTLPFRDWQAVLQFSGPLYIDSSWNGDFFADGSQLTFIARDVPATAPAHGESTFGAVLYSKELLTLESCELTGYRIVSPLDLTLFRVLLALAFLWLAALIMHIAIELRTRKYRRRQELDSTIIHQSMSTFTGFIDAKDAYTRGHSQRVAEYAAEIARRMRMDANAVTQLYYIALMHDCGKIGVPDAVLQKPGRLTEEEFKLVQSHTETGDAILVNFTAIPGIRDGAHFHHERFDGKGYPMGLEGRDIPQCARIICIADSFDAMNSNRCYRNHLSDERILSELNENAGRQFDPQLVPFMLAMIRDGYTRRVLEKYPNTIEKE